MGESQIKLLGLLVPWNTAGSPVTQIINTLDMGHTSLIIACTYFPAVVEGERVAR